MTKFVITGPNLKKIEVEASNRVEALVFACAQLHVTVWTEEEWTAFRERTEELKESKE